jgi:hypothetical protein
MLQRQRLMEKPDSYFSRFLNGRLPSSLLEKLFCVEQAVLELTPAEIYKNDVYEVQVFSRLPFIHLTISRRDGGRCDNWEHFQQIKNEIVGREYEAAELFPAQSRMVDAANEYHLWVSANASFRFPVKFEDRNVISHAARLLELARQVSNSLDDTALSDRVA